MRALLWSLRRSNAQPSLTGREGGLGISVRTCLPPSLNLYRRETEHAERHLRLTHPYQHRCNGELSHEASYHRPSQSLYELILVILHFLSHNGIETTIVHSVR